MVFLCNFPRKSSFCLDEIIVNLNVKQRRTFKIYQQNGKQNQAKFSYSFNSQ